MISGFEEWAVSAQQITTASFDQLQDRVLAVEAEDFINKILSNAPTKEPLLPALGGIPFAIEAVLESRLSTFQKHNIRPLFVFSGLGFIGQEDRKLQTAQQQATSVGNAWDLYNASDPERAVAEFGTSCTIHYEEMLRIVF